MLFRQSEKIPTEHKIINRICRGAHWAPLKILSFIPLLVYADRLVEGGAIFILYYLFNILYSLSRAPIERKCDGV